MPGSLPLGLAEWRLSDVAHLRLDLVLEVFRHANHGVRVALVARFVAPVVRAVEVPSTALDVR